MLKKNPRFLFITVSCLGWLLFTPLMANDLLLLEQESSLGAAEQKILDYDTAVSYISNQSLNLSIAENEIKAKQGQIKQAGLYPNPTFSYDLETSELGWKERQEIYAINQLIEMGGKREKQVKMACNEYHAALSGYNAVKIERLYQLAKSYIQSFAAQELLKIANEQKRTAEEFMQIAQSKHTSGKVSLIEKGKSEITQSLAHINVRQKQAALETSKKNLVLLWGGSDQDFHALAFPFYEISAPLPLDDYLKKLATQPEIVRAFYKNQAAYHNLRYEKSVRIPDVTLSVGYTYDAGDNGTVAGVILPLPIWNQNQGNIKKARHEMLKTSNEADQLWLVLEAKLSSAYIELLRNYQEALDIKNTLLKTASHTSNLALEGYKEGKFDYIDVLEAKRSLFEIREKYIQALVNYHTKLAEIEFLNSQTN